MRLLLCAALLAAGPAIAETQIARDGENWVRIYDKPCTVASVLRFIPEEYRKVFRRADARVGGQGFFACYVIVGDKVLLQYEDGDGGELGADKFSEDPGV